MSTPNNPYEAPAAPAGELRGESRRSWMRFVPAVVCIVYGVISSGCALVIVWVAIAPAELVRRAEVNPILRGMPPWTAGVLGLGGAAFFIAAALWVRGRYRKALILTIAVFAAMRLLSLVAKLLRHY